MALAVLAEHDAKPYAGFAITLVAELMKADHLCFSRALRARRCGEREGCDPHQGGGTTHRKF
jgi:hypothetical protein